MKTPLSVHTQNFFFEILLNQPEIRVYLPFSDWSVSKPKSVWFQINRKIVYTLWFRVDLIRFRKYFSVCMVSDHFPDLLRSRTSINQNRLSMNQKTFIVSQNGSRVVYTHKNLFEILLNQPEIRLYLPFSDWFGSKRTSVWFQINRCMVNTIWFRVDSIGFRKDFSVCSVKRKMRRKIIPHYIPTH